jgi:PAS domain S-box-containing protein
MKNCRAPDPSPPRKTAGDDPQEIKAVLEATLRAAKIGDWDLDLVHGTSRRSLRHDQCFGYAAPIPEADWGIDAFLRHVHPADREAVERSLRGAIRDVADWQADFRVVWPDGSEHWLAASGTPYAIHEGSATRMLGIVVDITERKRAELDNARLYADLQASEERLRTAIDTVPSLTWFCRPDGSAEFLNKQWCGFTGLTIAEGRDWGWTTAIHPDDLPMLDERWRETLRAGVPGEHEARMRRFDGEYRWFLFRCAPLLDASGAVVAWFGTNTDIEDRKRIEQALRVSAQLSRRQVEILKSSLDALSKEPDPTRLAGHILRSITEQFGAHSSSVWCRDRATGVVALEFVFEQGRIVHRDERRFAGMDLRLPMENEWPWPEVFRTGKASAIEDIREVPSFPLRDRLLPLGIVTVLLVPMAIMGQLEGAVGLRFTEVRSFSSEEVELAEALANQLMLAIRLTRLSQELRESAVLAERNRMARDIHDTLAQGFTGVIVQLEAADDARLRGLGAEADRHVRRAIDLARESLNEARRSVSALRPMALESRTLGDALPVLLGKMIEGTGLQMEFLVEGEPTALPSEWEDDLLQIGREVLTNALRHAHARRFRVVLTYAATEVCLALNDDGHGFDPSARTDGFGLLGIRERTQRMGGTLAIQSTPADGTTIAIAVAMT